MGERRKFNFQGNKVADSVTVPTTDLKKFIAFELSLIQEVEYVYTACRDNQVFYVWIVTHKWQRDVREKIYQRQQAIIEKFPEFAFDFYIVPKNGERVEDLISQSIDCAYERHAQD